MLSALSLHTMAEPCHDDFRPQAGKLWFDGNFIVYKLPVKVQLSGKPTYRPESSVRSRKTLQIKTHWL
jgi:hypothetical protein